MTIEQGFKIVLACHHNLIENMKKKAQAQHATNTAATVALKLRENGIPDIYIAAILFFGQRAYNLISEAYNSNTLKLDLYNLGLETENELRTYFQNELFLANRSWFYNDKKFWNPKILKMSLLDMILFFMVDSNTLWRLRNQLERKKGF